MAAIGERGWPAMAFSLSMDAIREKLFRVFNSWDWDVGRAHRFETRFVPRQFQSRALHWLGLRRELRTVRF